MDENIKALFNLFTYEQMTRKSTKDLAVSDFLCTFAGEEVKTYAYGSEQQVHTF